MIAISKWSGLHTRALRQAKRMSVREFAEHLGISDRTVSKWEAGREKTTPRPYMQAILDAALDRSSDDVRIRFQLLIDAVEDEVAGIPTAQKDGSTASSVLRTHRIRHPVDGKAMTLVPAGVFLCGGDNQPRWLPAFHIDITPVTREEYANFIAATGQRFPSGWRDGSYPDELSRHPVVNVTYWDAKRYATWAQKSLPSAQEWEKAARGDRGAVYPWGNQATIAKCNVRESGIGSTTPVDRYHSGTSPYGTYDMSGNVWEWCCTETQPGRYVLKGSAFTSPFTMAVAAALNDASADMSDDDTGFRCVARPDSIPRPIPSQATGSEGRPSQKAQGNT